MDIVVPHGEQAKVHLYRASQTYATRKAITLKINKKEGLQETSLNVFKLGINAL